MQRSWELEDPRIARTLETGYPDGEPEERDYDNDFWGDCDEDRAYEERRDRLWLAR